MIAPAIALLRVVSTLQWRPTPAWAAFTVLLFAVVLYEFDKLSEFIYFQF